MVGVHPIAGRVVAALVLAGLGWIAVQSTLNATAQLLLPTWARARALAYFQLVFMGGQAFGAVMWGVVADTLGLTAAFLLPAGDWCSPRVPGLLLVPLPARPRRPAQRAPVAASRRPWTGTRTPGRCWSP